MDQISASLERSLKVMEKRLFRDINSDMIRRDLRVFRREAAVYFMDGLASSDFLQHYIITPCQDQAMNELTTDLSDALLRTVRVGDAKAVATYAEAVDAIVNGKAVLLADGMPEALCFDIRFFVRRGISPPLTESVVNGPHQGFNEALRDNITLLRRILHTPELIGEMTTIGEASPTNLCVMYLKNAVDEHLLQRIKNRLKGIRVDQVLSIGALEQLVEDSPFALLPQCCLTERPDRAASFLLEGQIVIVMDGAPQVLAVPVSFLHLFHTPDDTSMRWQYGTFLRLIRLVGALCTLLLPGLFVAAVTFHPEALPVTLLTAILESQAQVPLSIPAETFLMLIMFNLINEAGTRVPGVVGNSLGTVSGLILGQAAVEARLIHPLLIIVVAVASLGSYAIPDYSLGMAFRIGQLVFLAAGCVFGLYGMVLLMIVMTVRMCGMTSLGSPFAAPVAPLRTHNPDGLIRYPIWRQRLRTWLGNPFNMDRASGKMRGWDRK
ncbi:MAG: spore germination protein [Clostridiales bacterium]|nr:spore germination protein [Clostridiales bacterium]